MSAMSSRDVSTESLSLTASSRSAAKAGGAAAPASTSVVIPAPVAKQNMEEVLRRGSPSTRGLHSISPLAPDAVRTPPADSRGPPRYLRARGITPSPAASAARGRREAREPPQPKQDGRRRRPFSRGRGDRHSSSSSSHRHQGEGKQGKAQAASPPQPQPSETASSGSQTPKRREMTAPPQLAVPAQPSDLPLPLPEKHRQLAPSDHQCGNQAQQEVQRRDRLSPRDDSGSAVAETQEQERPARAPPPRSKSPASAHASSLHECNGTTAAMARAPSRRGHVVDMVLTVPRLSPAQASSFAPSTQPQRTRRTGEDFRHGSSVQPAAWQQHLSKRPLQVGIPGRVGVPGKGSAAAEVTPSAARRGTALSTSPQLVSTSPIARSYVVQSFSSYLPGESTVLLGAHHRGGPSPSSAPPPPSSQAVGPSANVAAATSMPAVVIEVAVVAAAASSLPEPEVLQRYEDMLRHWHAGNGNGCSGGVPRHDGREAQQRYTHKDLAAAFDLIVHIQLATAAAVTVSDIKDEVELRTGLPAAQQCLVYDAVLLQDCLPVCLLPSSADDDGVGDERDAAMGRSAGPDCWRLVCMPLSSASSPAAMARQTRRIESPPRAVASPAAATDATRYDDGGDEAAAALRSLLSMSPVRPRTRTSRAAEATAAPPPRRPGAVPFTLSNGTTVAASATGLASTAIATAAASTAATAGNTEQVVSEHINRLRLLYLSNAETSDQAGRGDLGFAVAAVERAPEHADPSTAAMAGVRRPTRQQRDLLLSPLRAAPAVGAEHYRTRFGLSSSAAPIPSACTLPPPRRTELSDALIAALPPPPVRRPVTLPYESIKTLSWRPSVHQTQPTQPAQITASSSVGADANGGNGGGGVDASWMSSLSASFSSAAAAAVMM